MNRVEQLIVQALTTSTDNRLRTQAEATIFALLHESPTDFFLNTAAIVVAEDKSESLRQSAASVMKAILGKRAENGQYYWDLAGAQARGQIKEMLLSNLISPNVVVMRAGANLIAQVAAIEVPRGEWLEIVNSLAENSRHSEYNIRRASITTLGFICEELRHARSNVNPCTCESILASLLVCLRENGELVEIALEALRESVLFLQPILLGNQYLCDQLFEYVFPLLASDAFRSKVYGFLFEFAHYCYPMLTKYIPTVAQATAEHIDSRHEDAIQALEFWDSVGTEYLQRLQESNERVLAESGPPRNYIEELQDVFISNVMATFLIFSKEDLDFPELRESAVKTLTTCVACCSRRLFDRVTDGVSRVLQSANPGERQASALLFSCLVEFSDRDYTRKCFANGFGHLYQLVNDSEDIVRRNTLNGFVTLSEWFPEVFLGLKEIGAVCEQLLNLTKSGQEVVQILAVSILLNVSQGMKEASQCAVVRDPDSLLQQLIAIFTSNLTATGNRQLNEKVISVIMNVVMATTKRPVVVMLLTHLVALYIQYSQAKIRDKEIVLSQILTLAHTAVLAMIKFPVEAEVRRKAYELLDLHLQLHGVEVEGIHLIGAMALCFKRDFMQDRFDQCWSVIVQALEMVEQKPTFKSALTCLQDIARNQESRLAARLTPTLQRLLQYMHSPIDRDLKTEILRCFGDVVLGLRGYAETFLKSLIEICDECATAVHRLSEIESEREYAEELKETLVEAYHCLVFALNDQNGGINARLAAHFPIISRFIVVTCDVSCSPTVEYVKNCLCLLFDAALFYGRSSQYKEMVNQVITSREVNTLIDTLRKYSDKPGVSDTLAYIEDKVKNHRR